MQTTPTPGLLHQLSDLLQPRVQPQVVDERMPPPRKMVTAQRTVQQPTTERRPAPDVPQKARTPSAQAPSRNVPRGTFLNIVV